MQKRGKRVNYFPTCKEGYLVQERKKKNWKGKKGKGARIKEQNYALSNLLHQQQGTLFPEFESGENKKGGNGTVRRKGRKACIICLKTVAAARAT